MHWQSAAEFFAMGGYAFYVWGSFGACALLMLVEPLMAHARGKHVRASLRRERLAEQMEKEPRT